MRTGRIRGTGVVGSETAGICPVCSRGTVADIVYDAVPGSREPVQRSDGTQLVIYTCGHRVPGPALDTADQERLDVERRTSAETVDPGPSEPDG